MNKAARAIRQENVKKKEDAESTRRGKSASRKGIEELDKKDGETLSPTKSSAQIKNLAQADKYVTNKMQAEAEIKIKAQATILPPGSKSEARLNTGGNFGQTATVDQTTQKISPEKSKARVTFEGTIPADAKFNDTYQTQQTQQTVPIAQPDKVFEKINQDVSKIDPMHPPKNYLFSLSTKETNPKFYK